MGGGSAASFRWRRILLITSPCVMTAMIRSVPRRQKGHVAISSPKTRPSSLAHGQYGVPVWALSQSWVLEVQSENRISENQWLASFNFPVFGSLRQSPRSWGHPRGGSGTAVESHPHATRWQNRGQYA